MRCRTRRRRAKTRVLGLCASLLLPHTGAAIDANGFERYRVILDRAPFGSAASQSESAPSIPELETVAATHLRLTSIYEIGDLTRVGLVDQETNRSYVVREGAPEEENGGFTLIRANLTAGEAILQKDGQVFTLHISKEPILSIAAQQQQAEAQSSAAISRRPPWARRVRSTNNGDREDADAVRRRPTREEMEARLRAYREEVELQGLPPLPAPLTTD